MIIISSFKCCFGWVDKSHFDNNKCDSSNNFLVCSGVGNLECRAFLLDQMCSIVLG